MNSNNKTFLSLQDFSVTNESFDLLYDTELDMLITNPQPRLEDLGKYYESDGYISHTDSKKSFIDAIYQTVKKYAISRKVILINGGVKTLSDKSVLDVGCGTGDFLAECKNRGWKVCGVEPNEKARTKTKEKINQGPYINLEDVPKQQFDCITLWHVLEHVPDLENYILKLKSFLKPGGTLIIAVPNFKSFDAKHYGKFWAAYDVPRHLWHFSKQSIKILFERKQLAVEKVLPMKFDSFYVSLLSEKYKTGKSNFLNAIIIGLRSNLSAISSKQYSSLIYLIKHSK